MDIGIAASITCPTFSPEYADATVKTTHKSRPHPTDRGVSSGRTVDAGTIGIYAVPGESGVYAFAGSVLVSVAVGIVVELVSYYVRGGAPSGSGKWQISTDGGLHPIWSRDDRELFYEGLDNNIITASYTGKANSFDADKPRTWSNTQIRAYNFGVWNVDLAPDGKRFAVFPRPEAPDEQKGSVHVTVLLNFFVELRRRVPVGK